MTKDQLNDKLYRLWSNTPNHIFANITMGMGKTKCALRILQNESFNKLILTHTTNSRDVVWPNEMEKWNYDIQDLDIFQYAHISKIDKIYNVIVLDECHKITLNIFNFLKRQVEIGCRILFLTGTRPDDKQKLGFLNYFKSTILEYTLMDAVNDKNANDVEFRIVYCHQDDTIPKYKVFMRSGLFTERQAYLEYCKQIMNAKTDKLKELAINMRMWHIYKSETKLKAALYIRNQMLKENNRFIMFVTTKSIASSISDNVFHSGTKNTKYKDFLNGEINELITCEQLKTGENIPNLRYGIVTQIDAKKHNFEQLMGRFTRIEATLQKSIIYVIVLKDTMDFTWLRKASGNINKSYFKEYEISNEKLNSIKWPIE